MRNLLAVVAALVMAGTLAGCVVYGPGPYGGYYVQPAFAFGFAYYGGPYYGGYYGRPYYGGY